MPLIGLGIGVTFRTGGGGPNPVYWQQSAPADASGSANTISQLWAGAVTSNSFAWSVKCSAAAPVVRLVISEDPAMATGLYYSKEPVATADGIAKATVHGLPANKTWYWCVFVDGALKDDAIGRFKTLPSAPAFNFSLVLGSCSRNDTATSFTAMAAHNPLFFVQMGDIEYDAETNSTTLATQIAKYEGVFTNADIAGFYRTTPTWHVWSDHDFCGNNSNKDSAGKAAAQQAYRAKVPHDTLPDANGIYHSRRIGRLLFVFTDGRSYRSPVGDTDNASKTVLGTVQKQWLKDLLVAPENDGLAFVLVFPEPWSGTTDDGWGLYSTERNEIGDYIINNGLSGRVMMLSGDAHSVAIDGGSHVAGRFPLFQAAPLDQTTSDKGGTYDFGPYLSSQQQYGVMDVEDDGETITVTWTGYTGAGAQLATYSFDVDWVDSAPAYVQGAVAGDDATVTSQLISLPAPATAGNRIVVWAPVDKASGTISIDDAGMSLVASHTTGAGVSGAIFTKIAVGGEQTFNITIAAGRKMSAAIAEYSELGAPATNILGDGNSAIARTVTAGPLAVTAGQFALAFWGNDSFSTTRDNTSIGWSAGWTERLEQHTLGQTGPGTHNGEPGLSIAEQLIAATGNVSATFTYTGGTADENVAFIVAFDPA